MLGMNYSSQSVIDNSSNDVAHGMSGRQEDLNEELWVRIFIVQNNTRSGLSMAWKKCDDNMILSY